jgi:hypothetical protein
VLGTVTRGSRHFRGWVQASALTRNPRRSRRGCRDSVEFRNRIAFVNAPFHSITWLRSNNRWGKTGSASQSRLRRAGSAVAPDCTLHMNYDPGAAAGARLQDPVTPELEKKLFKRPAFARTTERIGYRYTTPAGDAALVSVKTGFKKGRERKNVGLWGFVKRDCVVPNKTYSPSSRANVIYQTEIRICDRPGDAVKRFNRRKKRLQRLRSVAPCKLPNSATKPGDPHPDSAAHGWRVGTLRLSG